MLIKQTPVCAKCRSPDIVIQAMLSWSDDIQDWQIASMNDDKASCGNCGATDAAIDWLDSDLG